MDYLPSTHVMRDLVGRSPLDFYVIMAGIFVGF
jgi:hypothetical protein